MGNINAVTPTPYHGGVEDALNSVLGALNAANLIYGFNTKSLQNKILKSQQELNDKLNDPNSTESELARRQSLSGINELGKKGYISKQDQSALSDLLLKGGENGAPLSAASIKSSEDTGLLSKVITGEMAADASAARLAALTQTRQTANAQRANHEYDNVLGKYEQRLDAADRVRDLIANVQSGKLIPSEYLSQQLANDINVLQTPTGRTTVSGTEHSRPNTLFGKGGQLIHFISGDPQAAVTPGDLGQMLKETDLLKKDIGDQQSRKFAGWIKGMPQELRPNLLDRFQESRQRFFPNTAIGASSLSEQSLPGNSPLPGNNAQAADLSAYHPDVFAEIKKRNLKLPQQNQTQPPIMNNQNPVQQTGSFVGQ